MKKRTSQQRRRALATGVNAQRKRAARLRAKKAFENGCLQQRNKKAMSRRNVSFEGRRSRDVSLRDIFVITRLQEMPPYIPLDRKLSDRWTVK